jgi:glutathione synthase/RimK-type ligase-like ATP-grasp enzyme
VDVALVTGEIPPIAVPTAATMDAPLDDALARRGVAVHHPAWRDAEVDWAAFDVAVVRTVWDYWHRRDSFVDWATSTSEATALWNPADVLRWNTHKSYLIELEDRGAPLVPTAWLARGDRVELADLVDARGWRRVVVKPAVAAGSDGLLRVDEPTPDAQDHLETLLAAGDVMVQPYLDRVETDGEVSVVLVEGEVSHVVRKRPEVGEYRIQQEFGGRYDRLALDGDGAEPAALGRWVVEASGHDYLYARVDLLPADDGAWQLAELEVTEPDLYLVHAPEAADRLADAIVRRSRRR